MNIHLIPQQKFTDKLVELIDQKYPKSTNLIYAFETGDGFDCIDAPCIQKIKNLSDVDFTLLEKSDKFFVHGFYDSRVLKFLYKNIRRFKRNQLVLICWGADIYNARYILQDHKLHLGIRLYEIIKKRIVKSCNIFMTFACADIEIVKKYYGGKGVQFDCLYPSNVNIELLDKLRNENLQKDTSHEKTIRILLGNSATSTNLHMQALDAMSKFSDENIEILCPLSYGDKEYGQKVIEYGKGLFKEKFKPILNYMSAEEYSELLNSVQVAVFNHNRQQGTGNIEILSYLGKKLFIRSDTTTWQHYVERDKCKFFDAMNIQSLNFNDFVAMSQEDVQCNYEYFKKIWDIDYVKSLWDKVMEYK